MITVWDSRKTLRDSRTNDGMASTPNAASRIRVLLVAEDLDYGGAERQVIELANNLDRDRFDVHVCALSDYVPLSSKLRDAERRLHIIKPLNRVDLTVILRLARLLRALKADIVHGYLYTADVVCRIAGRLAHTKAIIGSERNAFYPVPRLEFVGLKLTRRWVDTIVANSHAGAEYNANIYDRPASDYRIVHNGVDIERFRPKDGAMIRQELGIPPQCPVVGAFANFRPQKNHEMLFRAFSLVLERFPETRLLLVGDQPTQSKGRLNGYVERIRRLADDLKLGQRCMFMGFQTNTEHLYPACDITVLSSRYEGNPNVLLESMACGIPFVATNVSDNEYLSMKGEVGCLVSVGDTVGMAHHMKSLLGNPALRREMGQKARQWVVNEFSTRRFAEKVAAVYVEALQRDCTSM